MNTMSTPNARRRKLKALMAENGLNAHEVAELTGRKHQTVRLWTAGIRNVPGHALKLLELQVNGNVRA